MSNCSEYLNQLVSVIQIRMLDNCKVNARVNNKGKSKMAGVPEPPWEGRVDNGCCCETHIFQ